MDTAAVLTLARAKVSPNWLLLGHGPRVLSEESTVQGRLRDTLIQKVSARLGIRPEFVDAVLPASGELLEELVTPKAEAVRLRVEAKRAFDREEKKKRRRRLGLDSDETPNRDPIVKLIVARFLEEQESLRRLPPPDSDPSSYGRGRRLLGVASSEIVPGTGAPAVNPSGEKMPWL